MKTGKHGRERKVCTRRAGALLLGFAMICGLLPAMPAERVHAEEEMPAITTGATGILAGDRIWFGATGDEEDNPIIWRALMDTTNMDDPDGRYLLSEEVLGEGPICTVEEGTSVTEVVWAGSDAQKWCQEYYEEHFTEQEQEMILSTTGTDP